MHLHLLLDLAAEAAPDRVVLEDGDRRVTPPDIDRLATSVAHELRDGEHDALVYVGRWGLPYAAAVFGASRAGVPIVPLSFRLGAEQLERLLASHERALVVADDPHALAPAPSPRVRQADEWVESHVTASPRPVVEDHDGSGPAVLLYTSGSTSEPKAAILRHHHLVSYVMTTVDLASADEDQAVLVTAPPYHVAGLANLLSNLFAGRRMVACAAVDGDAWLDAATAAQATHAFLVPTLLQRVVEAQQARPRDLSSLRAIAYGGARTPPQTIRVAMDVLPQVAFTQAYGLTETSSTIAVLGPDDHRRAHDGDPVALARLASVGRPVPGIEVAVRDESGNDVPVGASGRIWLRGAQVSGEYANAAAALDEDGWFDTRDRGRVDEDGYLFVEGRDDDTIIRGAENIAPAEIEDVLLAHPSVNGVVVVGLPHDEWGQVPAAAVVLERGEVFDPEALTHWVRARLRSSKTPVRIESWDHLPMTENGKILRRAALARMLEPTVR